MKDVTSIKCENITEEIIQKYQKEGFKLVFQEYVMEHHLTVVFCQENGHLNLINKNA